MGKRWHVIMDGTVIGSAATKENALDMIRCYQEQEKKAHQWLHAQFSIIYGEEIYIEYK